MHFPFMQLLLCQGMHFWFVNGTLLRCQAVSTFRQIVAPSLIFSNTAVRSSNLAFFFSPLSSNIQNLRHFRRPEHTGLLISSAFSSRPTIILLTSDRNLPVLFLVAIMFPPCKLTPPEKNTNWRVPFNFSPTRITYTFLTAHHRAISKRSNNEPSDCLTRHQ